MGTNYYLHIEPTWEPLHIGKSSGGWCFSLHVMPEDGVNTLDDWRALWNSPYAHICNEYGEKVTVERMERVITHRTPECRRHDIDGRHCVAHGDGLWDYIAGEFS